jgi:putative phage-type endonuclease
MLERVRYLLEKPQPVQRTQEWFEARKHRITASNVATLLLRDEKTCKKYVELYGLGDYFDFDNKSCNPYSNKQQFIIDKIKQTFTGSPATYWGQKYEPIATQIYEKKFNTKVIEFGLLTHDTIPWIAASPDGITEDGTMLEIKCPYRRKITGVPTLYYYQQVQIQLEVADLEKCDFFEIEFVEISSMDEFIDDELQELPVEYKGLFLQIETVPDDYTRREYIYPPKEIFNDPMALKSWVNEKIEDTIIDKNYTITKIYDNSVVCNSSSYNKINIRTIYWKTQVVSVCTIDRDREWFENIKDFLKAEWDDVLIKKDSYKDNINSIKIEQDDECLF